jgi:ABC-2 type transport system permease protein
MGSIEFWSYPTANAYNFLGYASDGYGAPIAEVNYSLSLSVGSSIYNETGLTNSSGLVAFTVNASTSNGAGMQVSAMMSGRQGQSWSWSGQLNGYNNQQNSGSMLGSVQTLDGSTATYILNKSNKTELETVWAQLGSNGTAPAQSSLYYEYTSTVPSFVSLQQMNETQMQFLGSTEGIITILPVPPPPGNGAVSIITAVFASDGGLINIGYNQAVRVPPPSLTLSTALLPDLLIMTPVVGILAAFGAYGRERASGILDSVLTRPVSRRGLAVSRYVSVLIALAVASVIAVEVIAMLCSVIIGISIGPMFHVALILGVFVNIAAFAGIVFVLSRLFKSVAAILGVSAGLYLLTIFVPLFLSIPSSSVLTFDMLDPARYVVMVLSYLTNINILNLNSLGQFNPASVGLTVLSLSADAAMWIAVPFAVFLYLAVKKD